MDFKKEYSVYVSDKEDYIRLCDLLNQEPKENYFSFKGTLRIEDGKVTTPGGGVHILSLTEFEILLKESS